MILIEGAKKARKQIIDAACLALFIMVAIIGECYLWAKKHLF